MEALEAPLKHIILLPIYKKIITAPRHVYIPREIIWRFWDISYTIFRETHIFLFFKC